jgi:hypothetical protein
MSLRDEREVAVTREKLGRLETLYRSLDGPSPDQHVQELTLRSLRRTINQMKEELVRYNARPATTSARDE